MIAKLLTKEEYKEKCMRKDNFMSDSDRYEIKKYNFMKNYNITEEELTADLIEKYNDRKLMLTYNNLSSIIDTEEQNTDKKLDILKSNQQIGDEFRTCYQDFTFKNKYTYHYHTIMLLRYCGFNINDVDDKESAILKEIMDENMKGKINDQTLTEYIETEKNGLYWKFECRQLINNDIVDEFNFLLKIVNYIINKQYGLKIRTVTKAKKIKSYYLTTNKTWDDLPNQMISKNINEILVDNKDYSHVIDNLDNGLFIASDSDSDSDNE